MTFNIRNQNAETINNVAGNQTWVSGQRAQVLVIADAKRQLELLRRQVRELDISPETLEYAEQEMDGVDRELTSTQPNKKAVAGRIRRLTHLLQDVGALAQAGQALSSSLHGLGHWLGI